MNWEKGIVERLGGDEKEVGVLMNEVIKQSKIIFKEQLKTEGSWERGTYILQLHHSSQNRHMFAYFDHDQLLLFRNDYYFFLTAIFALSWVSESFFLIKSSLILQFSLFKLLPVCWISILSIFCSAQWYNDLKNCVKLCVSTYNQPH